MQFDEVVCEIFFGLCHGAAVASSGLCTWVGVLGLRRAENMKVCGQMHLFGLISLRGRSFVGGAAVRIFDGVHCL